jgi:hypothetical protein
MSKTLELLQQHPETTKLVQDWYMDKMLESFKDKSVPEDFKDMMRATPIDNDRIAKMIDGAPRLLFDFFDENDVIIQINTGKVFSYSINEGEVIAGGWDNRKEAEHAAISAAFELLENKIKEITEDEKDNK